jgi:Polymerase beta, Nucleotidyltransferase
MTFRRHSFADSDCGQQGVAKRSGTNRQASCNLSKRTITKPRHPASRSAFTSFKLAPSISAVYLFGSRVRGDHRNSDVDVHPFFDEWLIWSAGLGMVARANEIDFPI